MKKEHKLINLRERESKQKEQLNLHDDKYKFTPDNKDKMDKKFASNYVKGNLKDNIVFDDKFVIYYLFMLRKLINWKD